MSDHGATAPDVPADAVRQAPPEGMRVTIEIVEIQGTGACSIGHVVGDRWEVDSALVPTGICG